jgi:hypothetical protein
MLITRHMIIPNQIKQLFTTIALTGVLGQQHQQIKLFGRQIDAGSMKGYDPVAV